MERTQCQHLGQNVAEDIEAALSILFHLADLLDRLLHALGYLFFDVPAIILNGRQVRRLAGNGPAQTAEPSPNGNDIVVQSLRQQDQFRWFRRMISSALPQRGWKPTVCGCPSKKSIV